MKWQIWLFVKWLKSYSSFLRLMPNHFNWIFRKKVCLCQDCVTNADTRAGRRLLVYASWLTWMCRDDWTVLTVSEQVTRCLFFIVTPELDRSVHSWSPLLFLSSWCRASRACFPRHCYAFRKIVSGKLNFCQQYLLMLSFVVRCFIREVAGDEFPPLEIHVT
jgi:hypothetical protein